MAAISRISVVTKSLTSKHRLGLLSNHAFGSAPAIQYDYNDYEEEYEYEYDQRKPAAMVDTQGWAPERGVQWVMIGQPGARRHIFAERISKLLQVPHISMATLVRQQLSPRSPLYQQIASSLNEGKLVPEEIIFGLLTQKLEEGYSRGDTGFILDGIPRTRIQAEILDQIVHVDLVVNFKCSEENRFKNKVGARKFSTCQEHLIMDGSMTPTKQFQDQQVSSHRGNACKQNVRNESEPLEDYYRKQKKLLNFEVAGATGETWQGLLAALHLQHVNAISSSSHKLTA